jgi:hypothetical protein
MNCDILSVLKTLRDWKRELVLGAIMERIDPSSLPWSATDTEALTPVWEALASLDEVGRFTVFRLIVEE